MRYLNTIKTLGLEIIDLVFPLACISCGKDGQILCPECKSSLPRLQNQVCISCMRPSPYGKTHMECATKNTVDGLVSALPYSDPKIKNLIETYKYKFVSSLSQVLTEAVINELAKQNLTNYFKDFTLIPVPLHKRRFNWRGFNQAEIIAASLSRELNIPISTNLVFRTKFTKPQTKLNAAERKINIADAFIIAGKIAGNYILVDDVVTSGSTLNEIARTLKRAGASEIWGITAAHG